MSHQCGSPNTPHCDPLYYQPSVSIQHPTCTHKRKSHVMQQYSISNYVNVTLLPSPCTHGLVRQGYVDQLVQSARAQDGRVDDVWPVGGSDDEDVLLGAHAVHLSQHLVDDPVSCPTCHRGEGRGEGSGEGRGVERGGEEEGRGVGRGGRGRGGKEQR